MKANDLPHIVFTGGGTGGHLFPGLAVARRLVAEESHTRITFAGGGKPFERRLVAADGFDYIELRCRPMPRRIRDLPGFLADNWSGYRSAVRFLTWQRVAAVVGLGGYASVPMARAAVSCGVPLVLLEQNVVPGRATRWLAGSASMVCTSFEQTRRYLHAGCPLRVTGNPIRDGFSRRPVAVAWGASGQVDRNAHDRSTRVSDDESSRSGPNSRPRQLLVLGGSGGAAALNENIPKALHRLGSRLSGWKIVHVSGADQFESTRWNYLRLQIDAKVVPFVDDMPRTLLETDLAVCRSGGTTLAELAASGVPAVLLPYPYAKDDHQRKNADVFTEAGACLTLDQRELSTELDRALAVSLAGLLTDSTKRAAMSTEIRRLAHHDATWDVATMIRHLA